jgi:uncharacterized protein (DUF58 family)
VRTGAWGGPDFSLRWPKSLARLLWGLVVPTRGYRTVPTAAGLVLIALSFAVGSAAYNTASNILFIAFSLLLASLLLSGILAFHNIRRVRWRLTPAGPFRAGEEGRAVLEVTNGKGVLPTYALTFDAGLAGDTAQPLTLEGRLDPGTGVETPVILHPARRGRARLALQRVHSRYPFGFLVKSVELEHGVDVRVWPARVSVQRFTVLAPADAPQGEASKQHGPGGDLVSLRPYRPGDPPRHIHWKASARTRTLVLRQFAAERHQGFRMFVDPHDPRWRPGIAFETLCSLAAVLAEDLFREGRLSAVIVGGDAPLSVRRFSDVEAFLDRLAELEPGTGPGGRRPAGRRVITFEPAPPSGVRALVDGQVAATA